LLKEGKFPTISNQVQKIILYCQAGKRSQIAAQIFIEAGIHGIYHLDGGYEAYSR
jgi:rhodanese-related sulfurtransferase